MLTMNQQTDTLPKICIIGAGPCGLATAKNLLQQGLNNFTVFEKNTRLGGNWVFDEQCTHSSVYETTHIISSKRLSEFEDFPMPWEYPDYPSHRQILDYFESYARHFQIEPFIKFNTTVEQVSPVANNQWLVVYRDELGTHNSIYDYLLVANGHHWDPFIPQFSGHFDGEILHAHQYKKAAPFKDKRVLVVGGGNSACDIAVEISRISPKTCISMRRGQHIFPKFLFGKPTDILFAKLRWLPLGLKQFLAKHYIRVFQGRYPKYRLQKPTCKPLEIHPTINSELLYFIRHGKILPRQGIERFEGNTVFFADGLSDEFDVVIFATGYQTSFPFFDKNLIEYSTATNIPLYRKMMHPEFSNLYFIGLVQPQGCIWPLADYQAQIAAKIIAGKLKRPTDLVNKIQKEMKHSRSQYKNSIRHALEVDYQTFRRQLLKELKQSQ
ncbi:flavin-containing monooxygenase [Legionella hackeliae]|uniref:Flavin containing monooxygenase n=1 Tax=Legionella hackeliae TaxID=449 RepID=A0A0A8URW7_LEGHA|nr:NAD(P)-binding domain-containing protein [Legionella hackeliae]KTD15159.1 flavin containing monooxygenae [Legionella hackeliae]CEK11478.1 Flavin containing monooxygenase [Legionella hackeliae]STX48248.1 flavin containing monooxygenae [Legionella hackeliae]